MTGKADGTGSGIASLSYRFDNLSEIPLVFNAAGNFDQVIDFTGIDNGDTLAESLRDRILAITTTDIAGNATTRQFDIIVANGGGTGNNAPEIISQPETEYIVLRNSNAKIKGITLGSTQTGLAEIQGQAFLDFDRNGVRSKEAALDGFVVELVNSTTGEVVGTQITRSFDVNGDGKIDPFAITQIKDPTGKAILYGYDARGNLVSVSDRNNNATQFVYNNPNRPSFLTEIIDPLGRKGKEYMGIERSTFVISPDQKIAHTWAKVKTKDHAQSVLKQLQALVS